MFFRLPLGSARRFAALLLLLGIVFGGSVDAAACESADEIAEITALVSDHSGEQQLPDHSRHGACTHGHCHHGAQHVPPIIFQTDPLLAHAEYTPSGERRLGSIIPACLKRPPRA